MPTCIAKSQRSIVIQTTWCLSSLTPWPTVYIFSQPMPHKLAVLKRRKTYSGQNYKITYPCAHKKILLFAWFKQPCQMYAGNGYGTRNVDRHQILDFAEANDFIISNTFFKKCTSHLITYTSGDHTSQIDLILVQLCNFPSITMWRSFHLILIWIEWKQGGPC